jgi:hypothetical protein
MWCCELFLIDIQLNDYDYDVNSKIFGKVRTFINQSKDFRANVDIKQCYKYIIDIKKNTFCCSRSDISESDIESLFSLIIFYCT